MRRAVGWSWWAWTQDEDRCGKPFVSAQGPSFPHVSGPRNAVGVGARTVRRPGKGPLLATARRVAVRHATRRTALSATARSHARGLSNCANRWVSRPARTNA